MLTSFLTYALWLTPPLVLAGLAVTLVRRNLRNEYPCFFAYVVYQVVQTPLLFYFYHRAAGDEYFFVYWASAGAGSLLGLAVIYELFQHAFKPFENLRHMSRTLFGWAAVLSALMLVIFALGVSGQVTDRVVATVLVAQRSVRVMQIALVLLMLLFASSLGLKWRNHIMGIAAGFGIFASVDLLLTSIVPRVDPAWHGTLSLVKSTTYLLSTMIWFGVLYRTEPERVPQVQPAAAPEAEAFSFALPESSLPAPPDSLLLSMEKMVERRLNGHNGHGHGNGNGTGQKRPNNGSASGHKDS